MSLLKNFGLTFESLVEMVIPSLKNQASFKDFMDAQSKDIAFATNSIYWTAFALIEQKEF
jgi:hypothetical protein